MSKNMLLVEGDFDKGFLQKLCNDLVGINTVAVTVLAPKDIGARKNTWRAIIDNLPILLSESELDEGAKSFEKLGIVLDADYPPDNTGDLMPVINLWQKRYLIMAIFPAQILVALMAERFLPTKVDCFHQ